MASLITGVNRTLRRWTNPQTAAQSSIIRSNRHGIQSLRGSKRGDRFAVAYGSGRVEVWASERLTSPIWSNQKRDDHVTSLEFTYTGSIIVGTFDGTLRLHTARFGEEQARVVAHQEMINSAAISIDGTVVTGGNDGLIKFWRPIRHEKAGFLAGKSVVALPLDATRIISADLNSDLVVWDLSNGQAIRRINTQQKGIFIAILLNDGIHVAAGGWDGSVKVFNIETGGLLRSFDFMKLKTGSK